jgi:hypothetical protein
MSCHERKERVGGGGVRKNGEEEPKGKGRVRGG